LSETRKYDEAVSRDTLRRADEVGAKMTTLEQKSDYSGGLSKWLS
jgi:hypothetical protein